MDIVKAQRRAEKLLGSIAEVRFNPYSGEYAVGINVTGEFLYYATSTVSWEEALDLTQEVKNAANMEKI